MDTLTLIPHAFAKNMIMKDMMNNIMTQTLTIDEAIEKAVMKTPEQYLWNYNRYKGVAHHVKNPEPKESDSCK